MVYKVLVNDRKMVSAKMKELTGEKPVYSGMPRCAYILRGIAIEKNGEVTTERSADKELIKALIELGMIEQLEADSTESQDEMPEEEATDEDPAGDPEGTAEEAQAEDPDEATEEPPAQKPEDAGEEPEGTAEEAPATESDEATEEPPAQEPEDDDEEPENTAEEAPEEEALQVPVEEATDEPEDAAEEPEDTAEETPAEDLEETQEEDLYAELEDHETQAIKVTVSFPLGDHRVDSICNLVCLIYSKGSLMSKATQGIFWASGKLVEELQSGSIVTKEDALDAIRSAGQENLRGLIFDEEKVTFDGFPETADADVRRAWIVFAEAINRTSIRQKHVQAKETDERNEKYAMRNWLNRLGMSGVELKEERNLLYKHLTGHTAFRTERDMQKWMKRQAEKKEILRRLKESALEEAREAEG